jgi:NAD(P)H-dependent FMN reductase
MLKVAIIVGSTRPGRKADTVANWVFDIATRRGDASFEIVDIADFDLPLLDEAYPPSMGQYSQPHTHAWAEKIAGYDAFVFVTPEYNHSMSGALKNAIDYLYREWNDKAAGFVGYGSVGGARAVEQLRLVMGELKVADVRAAVALSLFTDFEQFTIFKPQPGQEAAVEAMLNDLLAWGRALQAMRLGAGERGAL